MWASIRLTPRRDSLGLEAYNSGGWSQASRRQGLAIHKTKATLKGLERTVTGLGKCKGNDKLFIPC